MTWGDTQIRLAVKRTQARGAGDLVRNPVEDIGTEEEQNAGQSDASASLQMGTASPKRPRQLRAASASDAMPPSGDYIALPQAIPAALTENGPPLCRVSDLGPRDDSRQWLSGFARSRGD